MNNKPDINDLFEAARRVETDRKRQQKLSDMIDRMAAAETQRRRRPLWVYSSVAAGILLLVTVGLRALYGGADGTGNAPVVAETRPVQPVIVSDTASADIQTALDAAPKYTAPVRNAVLAEATPSSQLEEQPVETRIEPETLPLPQADVPLLVESVVTVPTDTPQVAAAQKHIYERTSSRLVCGSGCKPEQRQDPAANTPQVAFVNNAGNSTDFEVGSISF